MIKKHPILRGACVLLAALCLSLGAFAWKLRQEQRCLAKKLIRLHVVAASDDPADQAQKLEVRDAILPVAEALTGNCATAEEAALRLREGFPQLRAAAETVLADDPSATLRLSLGEETFPRRDYPTFSLPAGTYRALRVVIGPGQGHNWWCVAFPALCLPAEEQFAETARTAGLEEDQVELMTADTPTVQIKFRLLDWLTDLFG